MTPTILTYSGYYFDFLEPNRSVITVEDIAHALSNVCRFGGHVRHHYSVAQHAVLVSHLVPPEYAFFGLHHDDPEAYLGDIPTPLKRILPDYRNIEHKVEHAIFNTFGLPDIMPPEIKIADRIALATEQRDLMPQIPHKDAWDVIKDVVPNEAKIVKMSPEQAEKLFLDRHIELWEKRHG